MGQVLSGPFAKISHRPKTSRYKTHLRLFLATPIVGFILLPKQKKTAKKITKKTAKKRNKKQTCKEMLANWRKKITPHLF